MNKGFTMVELLAAIVILALILIIAMPAYNNVARNVRAQTYTNKAKAISSAMQQYASKYLMDEIKPATTTSCPGGTSTNCCQQYDLYEYVVKYGIYVAEEDVVIANEFESETGPKIVDPVDNRKLKGCVKVRYTINTSGSNKLESKFVRSNECRTGIKVACNSW